MKKLSLITVLIGIFSFASAQRIQMGDWTAGLDSIATDAQIKEWTFYFGGSDEFIIKDRKPQAITTKNHRPVVHDNRIFIESGTKGRIEDIQYVLVDSVPDPNQEAGEDVVKYIRHFKKVYYLRLEKDGKDIATVPFTAGAYPGKDQPFTLDLKGKTFTYNGHFFELENGLATLQLPLKFLNDFKKASGYGF